MPTHWSRVACALPRAYAFSMRAARRVWAAVGLVQVLGAWAGCTGSGSAVDGGGSSGSSGSSSASGSGGSASAGLGGAAGAGLGGAASQPDAQCPRSLRPDEFAPLSSLCAACPGMECSGTGVTCGSSWHASGGPWDETCHCIDGHMVCCSGSKGGPGSWGCAYGSEPPPQCPSALPPNGAACGEKPMYCHYPSSCCTSSAVASCRGGIWQLDCAYDFDLPTTPSSCEGGAAGAAGAAGAHN